MDIEQTMRYLEESKCNQKQGDEYQKIHNEMLSIAIKALEKQIPKKVGEVLGDYENSYYCDRCGRSLRYEHQKYCEDCGGKQSW